MCVVIGGCGFLGRHLVESLVARGYQVRVFDLYTSFSHEGVVFYTGNLCKKEVRNKCVELTGLTCTCTLYACRIFSQC